MSHYRTPTRIKRRLKRAREIGPERMISHVSVDRRVETLTCGHQLVDAPIFDTPNRKPHPPKYRRCIQCRDNISSPT